MAAIHGVRIAAQTDEDVAIVTDSMYVVKAMNEWRQNWIACGWSRQLVNKEFLKHLSDAVDARLPHKTFFVHVKGHKNDVGNTQADLLATRGARMDVV